MTAFKGKCCVFVTLFWEGCREFNVVSIKDNHETLLDLKLIVESVVESLICVGSTTNVSKWASCVVKVAPIDMKEFIAWKLQIDQLGCTILR